MIGSRMSAKLGCAPKMRRAIGTPEASVFLEPQNSAAMRSGRWKPHSPAKSQVSPSATLNSSSEAAAEIASGQPPLLQTPPFTESQNDVYTSSKIVSRSITLMRALCAVASRPKSGRAA